MPSCCCLTAQQGPRSAEAAFSFRGQGVGRHSTLHVGHVQNSRLLGPRTPPLLATQGSRPPQPRRTLAGPCGCLRRAAGTPTQPQLGRGAQKGRSWHSHPHRDTGSVQHPAQCALAQLFMGDWEARSPTATLTFCPWPRGQVCFAISVLCGVSMTCEVTVWLRLGSGQWSIPGCWVHGALPWTDTGGSPVTCGPSQHFLERLLCGGGPGGGSRNFCGKPGTAGQEA